MPRGRPRKTPEDLLVKSAEFIGWALGGLEREIAETRERLTMLNQQAAKLRARIGARVRQAGAADEAVTEETPGGRTARKRKKMSADAKRRISEAMRKRWAERKRKTG